MRVNSGLLGWGLFFILVGAVPLAVQAGYLTSAQVGSWWSLWPLILVGIGVSIVLHRTRYAFLGGLIVSATFGLMVGGAVSGGIGGVPLAGCGGEGSPGMAFAPKSGQFTGQASVELRFDCGDLAVATAAGSTWSLDGSDATGAGPKTEATGTSLRLESADRPPFPTSGGRDAWRLTLPNGAPLGLDIHLNAGAADIDLAGLAVRPMTLAMNAGDIHLDLSAATSVEPLDVTVNAGSLGIDLPSVSMAGTIQANAGAIRLCAPDGVGLRLTTGGGLAASYDYGNHGLVQSGDTWTSPGYESATVRIDLNTRGNAASFSLDPAGGCART